MGLETAGDELHLQPLAFVVYLLTFSCYGARLRGDEKGSVDRARKGRSGSIEPSIGLMNYGRSVMTHPEARLELSEALTVLTAIRETCRLRRWTLLGAHVRSTHVHMVVDGIIETSRAIRDLKAYASRALNGNGTRRRWARGGNALLLRDSKAVYAAIRYVVDGQGPRMAAYVATELFDRVHDHR